MNIDVLKSFCRKEKTLPDMGDMPLFRTFCICIVDISVYFFIDKKKDVGQV